MPWLGLVGKDRAFGVFADGSNRKLTALGRGNPRRNLVEREHETAARMEELCRALYGPARYPPYVNAPGGSGIRPRIDNATPRPENPCGGRFVSLLLRAPGACAR